MERKKKKNLAIHGTWNIKARVCLDYRSLLAIADIFMYVFFYILYICIIAYIHNIHNMLMQFSYTHQRVTFRFFHRWEVGPWENLLDSILNFIIGYHLCVCVSMCIFLSACRIYYIYACVCSNHRYDHARWLSWVSDNCVYKRCHSIFIFHFLKGKKLVNSEI